MDERLEEEEEEEEDKRINRTSKQFRCDAFPPPDLSGEAQTKCRAKTAAIPLLASRVGVALSQV